MACNRTANKLKSKVSLCLSGSSLDLNLPRTFADSQFQEPASQPEEKAAQPPDDIEDPSSLYAVPHKNVQKDIKQREESLAELARTVEVMQEVFFFF